MAKLLGSLKGHKIKVEKDVKAGEEITVDLSNLAFDFDQDDFDEKVKDRIAKERAKGAEQAKAEFEAAQKKKEQDGKTGEEATAAEILELRKKADEQEKARVELEGRLAKKDLDEKIAEALEKKGYKLPSIYRKGIDLPVDASSQKIAAAVDAANESYLADLKESGAELPAEDGKGGKKTSTQESGAFGRRGNGGGNAAGADAAKLVSKIQKNRPDLWRFVKGMDPTRQAKALEEYEGKGELEPKARAGASA